MAAGFVHGVLNSDNMNITGESFDYGPYRFLPQSDPNFVAAYFDESGLYSFGRQPEAVFWDLQQLGGALAPVTEVEPLVEALNRFSGGYHKALTAAVLNRLGLVSLDPEADIGLVNLAFRALAEGGEDLRWEPFFFDWFWWRSVRAQGIGRATSGPIWQQNRLWPALSGALGRLRAGADPSGWTAPISPVPNRKSCSSTKSRRYGRRSPSATIGRRSTPSSRRSTRPAWHGRWRPLAEPTPNRVG